MVSFVSRNTRLILPLAILNGAPVIIVNEKRQTLLRALGKTSKVLSAKSSTFYLNFNQSTILR